MWFTTLFIVPNKSLPNKVIESPYHAIYFPYSVNLNSDSTRTAPVVNTSPFADMKSFLIVRYLIFDCFLVDESIVCSQFFVRYFFLGLICNFRVKISEKNFRKINPFPIGRPVRERFPRGIPKVTAESKSYEIFWSALEKLPQET